MQKGHELLLLEGLKRLDNLEQLLVALSGAATTSATEATLIQVRDGIYLVDANITGARAAIDSIDSAVALLQSGQTVSNGHLLNILTAVNAIDTNTDELETRLATLITGQTLQATAANQVSGNTKLDSMITAISLLATAAGQSSSNTKLDTLITAAGLQATAALQGTNNTKLDSIITALGTLATDSRLTSTNTKLDTVITALGTLATQTTTAAIKTNTDDIKAEMLKYGKFTQNNNGITKITVADTAVGLGTLPAGTVGAIISVESGDVRISFAPGIPPTATTGILVRKNSIIHLGEGAQFDVTEVSNFRVIRAAATSAVLNISFVKKA